MKWQKRNSENRNSENKVWMVGICRCSRRVCCLICVVCCVCILASCGVQDRAFVLTEEDLSGQVHADVGTIEAADSDLRTIVVFVCGAVLNPGVVELPEGSRAADALEAAGGLLAEAQEDYVNLAVKLEDAQKLYFPTKEEATLLRQEERATASGLVNINTADAEQLCTLPGIGEMRAEAIVAYREQNGVFRNKEDVMKVSGIKQNAYDKLQDYITVD